MKICKNLAQNNSIETLDEWYLKCPPQGHELHWVDGRSAKETAKLWLREIPKEFKILLSDFNLKFEIVSPELKTSFDKYQGNVRTHDLLIIARDKKNEKVVISIESKVDESYNKTIGTYLKTIKRKKENDKNSNADKRIEHLRMAIFPQVEKDVFKSLRYQLLTALAGTLVEAKKQKVKTAVFLVQTFVSSSLKSKKYQKNQRDLDHFIEVISKGKHCVIHDNDLFGPFKFPGNEFIPDDVELWIGKYSIKF